uniref:uncharacterized protein LOC122587644 n=1 Tax=Erigeron canadensis TaxID=72917 RepID=UPI001CB89D3B|nr:uncharacterized protein LOC122587644 [Erigeron canadensis]
MQKLTKTVEANQEFTQAQFKILESRITENGPQITPRNLFATPVSSALPGFAPFSTTIPTASRNFGSNIPQNTQAAGTSANAGSGLPNENNFTRSFGYTNPLHEQGTNEYIAREFQMIKEMISSVPGFCNPIPKVNPASYLINIYGDRIANVEIPKKFHVPNMKPYNGTADPQEHIALYLEKMETVSIPYNLKEVCLCRSFGSTLSGSTLKMAAEFAPRSINSFADLTNLFYSHFSCSRTFEKLTDDLYKITQKQHESLRDFMTRFTKESLNIPKLNMLTAIQALQRGLHQGSKFQEDFIMTPCGNLDEAKARAARFTRLEENELTTAKLEALSYDRPNRKTETPVFKPRHKPYTRHVQIQFGAVEEEEGVEYPALSTYCFTVGIPGLIMALRNLGDKVRWTQKKNNDGYFKKKDTSQWCAYHEDFCHITEDCKMLRREICILLSNGYLTELMGRKKAKDVEGMDLTKPKPAQKADSPPANAKVINTISGGSEVCGTSYSAAKGFAKQNKAEKREKNVKKASISDLDTISFEDDDFDDIIEPHHDGLVVTLFIANHYVRRILINNGGSVNIIKLETLRRMDISEDNIIGKISPLIGFSGETKYTVGEIKLPVYVEGLNSMQKFCVVDVLPGCNIILGRPWIHEMRVVPSTYHQCVKISTPWGVVTVKGDQQEAKECYTSSMKSTAKPTAQ